MCDRQFLIFRFLSTPSGWRATDWTEIFGPVLGISIHALRVEGDDTVTIRYPQLGVISIHALRVEGDYLHQTQKPHEIYFYPRPPGGGRQILMRLSQLLSEFLSTPSGWRATVVLVALFPRCFNFYPRPPGGGRPFCISKDICVYNFYPRPPGGGRLSHSMFPRTAETISIHALRVEGDKIAPFVKHLHYISIHALRVEGDKSIFDRLRRRIRNFYPRPPGGGRPSAFHPYTPAV